MIRYENYIKLKNKDGNTNVGCAMKYIETDPDNRHCINCGWFKSGTAVYSSYARMCTCKKSKNYKKAIPASNSCECWKQWNAKT